MFLLKINKEKGEVWLVRNKRKGITLVAKRVLGEEIKIRCFRCALKYICIGPKTPCDDFLPDHVFFEDNGNKDNTSWRRESKNDPK